MDVYAINWRLRCSLDDLVGVVTTWVKRKVYNDFDDNVLKIRQDGLHVDLGSDCKGMIRSVYSPEGDADYPRYFAFVLEHPDTSHYKQGRSWITEISARHRKPEDDFIYMSVKLSVEDSSALTAENPLVIAPPTLVAKLSHLAIPDESTPNFEVVEITSDDEAVHYAQCEDMPYSRRPFPTVVIRPDYQGVMPVNEVLLCRKLTGIAEIAVVRGNINDMGRILPRRGGMVIAWPRRDGGIPRTRIDPEEIMDNKNVLNHVLGLITRVTNPAMRAGHFSLAHVHRELNQRMLDKLSRENEDYQNVHLRVLESEKDELQRELERLEKAYEWENGQLIDDLDRMTEERNDLKRKILDMEKQIEWEKKQSAGTLDPTQVHQLLQLLKPTPLQTVMAMKIIFPDRFILLPEAKASAERSNGFKYPEEFVELLWKFLTEYWQGLTDGGVGDGVARACLGDHYAQNDGESGRTKMARKRRQRTYDGKVFGMEPHLKIGNTESPQTSIRVHFEWHEGQFLIGHIGPHLDKDR